MKWMGKSVISDVDNTLVEYSRVNYHIIIYTMFQIFKFFFFFLRFYFFSEGKEGRKHQCVVVSHMLPPLETRPATQAWAPTGIWTSDPLLHRPAPNPLSHTSQGQIFKFLMTNVRNSPWKLPLLLKVTQILSGPLLPSPDHTCLIWAKWNQNLLLPNLILLLPNY